MTTTDPTITIAGLRAQVATLIDHLDSANTSRGDFSSLYSQHSAKVAAAEAERDALAAQLAEVRAELAAAPKVCAIHSYALEGPCMTCGAPWPGAEKALRQERIEGMEKMRRISRAVGCPNSVEEVVEAVAALKSNLASERAHLAACRTRIAGLEQAADERSAEVARLTARVAELEARPVLTHEILSAAIKKARKVPPYIARQAADEYMPHLGPVTLPAQDRAEELVSAWRGICTDSATCDLDPAERMRRALASLGAPPTSPPVTIDADALYARCERDFMGGYSGPLYDAFKHGMWTVCNVLRSTKPTSPPAARPVFAGVSVEELVVQYLMAGDPGLDPGVARSMVSGPRRAGVAAVLARLEVSLVAPVDPEAVAAAILAAVGGSSEAPAKEWKAATKACRAALTAAGIPVTPEVGK